MEGQSDTVGLEDQCEAGGFEDRGEAGGNEDMEELEGIRAQVQPKAQKSMVELGGQQTKERQWDKGDQWNQRKDRLRWNQGINKQRLSCRIGGPRKNHGLRASRWSRRVRSVPNCTTPKAMVAEKSQ